MATKLYNRGGYENLWCRKCGDFTKHFRKPVFLDSSIIQETCQKCNVVLYNKGNTYYKEGYGHVY
jgi:hypothetical protein